ncbi:MAG: LLM class flavin-dependent oxidoreductase [Xanthobacteraceae bacterium]|jgi:alkanesulfonate monooxygenase SsuD/methylene tetrahydromethanopterin reductase-like flavin-dependent oxidoreductase (luciferase family)
MKFHWFHLMPYPYLPDDFKQKYRSVWVDPPAAELYDPVKGHQVYNDYLDQLEYAERCGYDGICVNEHHQNGYGLMPSPNLMAAALTRRTSKAKLVVLGNSVALYDPPIRVAEEMAMLDVMSGGRLVAGFPVGTPMDTTYCYGANPATLRDKYREGVELIVRAWKERRPFTFNGKFTQLRYVNPWPVPIQTPRPPVWIPGGGSIETWEWCINNDFLYAYLTYFGYMAGISVIDGYWETVERLGAEFNPYRCAFLQFVGVAENDAEAEKLYAQPAQYFYNRCFHLDPGFVGPPGYTSIETMRKGIQSAVRTAARKVQGQDLAWKEIIDSGCVVAGSPQTVIDRLNDMADRMKVGHVMLLMHFGNMKHETVLYNTTRFAKEVAPKLRHRFNEYEDKWWPKDTLKEIQTPAPLAAE